jgi:hypothetical protein
MRRTVKEQAEDNSLRQRIQAAKTRKESVWIAAIDGRLVEPLNLPFADLDDNQKPTMCRYPTLEAAGRQLFCARPTEHGTSYCDDCCRVVYTAEGYDRQINKGAPMRQPMNGYVAAPFRMPIMGGLVREAPFA